MRRVLRYFTLKLTKLLCMGRVIGSQQPEYRTCFALATHGVPLINTQQRSKYTHVTALARSYNGSVS